MKGTKNTYARLLECNNKYGKLQFPMKICKSKVFSTDEYLVWDSDNIFCKDLNFFQAEIKEYFVSGLLLIYINLTVNIFHNEIT